MMVAAAGTLGALARQAVELRPEEGGAAATFAWKRGRFHRVPLALPLGINPPCSSAG